MSAAIHWAPDRRRAGDRCRDFAAAVKAAGKQVTVVEGKNYAHMEMGESIANPYAPCGRAALANMGLGDA
jgi:arylformamidase